MFKVIDTDCGYEFSEYGQGLGKVSARYVVTQGVSLREVDVISILSMCLSNKSEIYFQGKKLRVNMDGLKLYGLLARSVKRESYLAFKVDRPEKQGLSQFLIPVMKGTISKSEISDLVNLKDDLWY